MAQIPIPTFIQSELHNHINSECDEAEAGWNSANEDEDCITGDFFSRLRTGAPKELNGFQWSFGYKKFRGRGKDALEKTTGADGIITIEYNDRTSGKTLYKSLLVQAKKGKAPVNYGQWDTMQKYCPGGNIIIRYGANGYKAISDRKVMKEERLCDFLANSFLKCTSGLHGVYYDGTKKVLHLQNGGIVKKPNLKEEAKIKIVKVR